MQIPFTNGEAIVHAAVHQGTGFGSGATGPHFHGVNAVFIGRHKLDLSQGSTLISSKVSGIKHVGDVKLSRGIGTNAIAQGFRIAPGNPIAFQRRNGAAPVQGNVVAIHCSGQIKRSNHIGDHHIGRTRRDRFTAVVVSGNCVSIFADRQIYIVINDSCRAGYSADQSAITIDLVAQKIAVDISLSRNRNGNTRRAGNGAGTIGLMYWCSKTNRYFAHGHIIHEEDEGIVGNALDSKADFLTYIG
ncbi:hypothetical protein DSECCO2_459720 [anaerobic digester metagenome]